VKHKVIVGHILQKMANGVTLAIVHGILEKNVHMKVNAMVFGVSAKILIEKEMISLSKYICYKNMLIG